MKFPVYSERPANTESVIPPLQEIFRGTDVQVIEFDSADLRNGLLREKDTVGFSLPGIIGEISAYTDQIGETGLREMSEAIREGRVMLAICAGAYFITRQTIYEPSWGLKKERTPLNHIFKAVARGPIADMGGRYDPEFWPSDLSLAQVWYKAAGKPHGKEHWKHAAVAYGNGPSFYLDDPQDPALEPLAFYSHVPNMPIAAASLQHGEGKVLLLGALPHIGYQDVAPHPGTERIRRLLDDMKAHEPKRREFMDSVAARLQAQILTYREKFSI